MDPFKIYYDFLISENNKYNLTSITDEEEVYYKHFQDSLKTSLALDFTKVQTLCDIGSGAGFPGIPLKIAYPHLQLTIIEPTQKRCRFLEQLVLKLSLNGVIIRNERAEDIKDLREKFDVVCARAVASLPVLLELCIPYVKVGGYFIALKGSNYQEEVNNSKNALEVLKSEIEDIIVYELDKGYGTHSLIKIKKNFPTNKIYPRRFSLIKKQSL